MASLVLTLMSTSGSPGSPPPKGTVVQIASYNTNLQGEYLN